MNIKFLVKLGKSGREIFEMLERVYGESAMKRRTVYKWVDRFRNRRESVDDDARENRPSTSRVDENIKRVHDLVMSDRRITTSMIAAKLGISKGSVRPELWAKQNWILHHDNAPSHTALNVREFATKNGIITTDHPPYSPDLVPCDFFLFPKIKIIMRGEHFGDVENIKPEVTRLLNGLTSQDMQHCFKQWKDRWAKCILSGGEYFEGDHVSVVE